MRAWDAPDPETLTSNDRPGFLQMRPITGSIGTVGSKRMWLREPRQLVSGIPLSAFLRAATVADLANPFSNAGDKGLAYINSDLTLYLHRVPQGEWIGMDVVNHHATDGVAIGQVVLYDCNGAIGTASVCGPAQPRMAAAGPRPRS